MIDVHCHLEQPDYDKDRDEVIERAKKELKAVITSCANPKDFDLTLSLVEKYRGFVFAVAGIHPEYVKEISEKEKDEFLEKIKSNRENFVGMGEVGLDYNWLKDEEGRKKQKELFIEFISFAKEINLPLTIHSRDAHEETIKILDQEDAKQVHLHLFGDYHSVKKIIEKRWYVSIGPIVLRSKKYGKVVRDMPLEFLLLETDAPWNHPLVFSEGKKVRNEPTSIRVVAEKIAEIKKIGFDKVWEECGENAIKFFNLNL